MATVGHWVRWRAGTPSVMASNTPPIDAPRRLALRPSECATSLGVSERTLRRWMREEGLPFFRVERGIFLPVAELEAWMTQRLESQHTTDELAEEILRDL